MRQKSLAYNDGLISAVERGGTEPVGTGMKWFRQALTVENPTLWGRGGGLQGTAPLATGERHAPLEASIVRIV